MIKLYLKTLTIVILLIYFVLSVYQIGFSYITKENFNSINQLISKGTFSYLQKILEKTPESDWASTVTQLQPSDASPAKILPINSLPLNEKDKLQLLNGNIVFKSEKNFHFIYFLYYGVFESFGLQRIGKSQYALQIMLTEPINQTINNTMPWIAHIILRELNNTSKENRPLTLKKLQISFDMPLKLIPRNSDVITPKMQQDLNTYALAYSKPETGKPISTLYIPTSDPQKLLVIGPIQYSPLSSLFSVAQDYYFISFAFASIFIVLFLTWLFSRNILKIFQITKRYSIGDFSQGAKVRSFSILHGAYENVVSMGNNLKRLIQSQENMTRFVAHEVRTPLSTMQFALDSLKKEKDLSESTQNKLISIQEDIEDINKVVNYFLLYYKTTSHELRLKSKILNIFNWLNNTVKRYELSKINVTLLQATQENIMISFDPNLLKHVLDNLITNALKVARQNVLVSLALDRHYVEIHVEDDGPGIPELEIKNIFEPFSTLNNAQDLSKHIGLGLSIAKSIIELHNGSIVVSKSNQLGGARFIIKLPIGSPNSRSSNSANLIVV